MKLPEALKHGILSGDWNVICTIYTMITGEPISPPKIEPREPDWANIDIDMSARPTRAPKEKIVAVIKDTQIDEDVAASLVQEEVGRSTVTLSNIRENKFIDNPNAFANERVDVNPSLGVTVKPRGERTDKSLVEVQCKNCGKKETVSQSLAYGYHKDKDDNTYKCNDCCCSKARRTE